MKIRKRLLSLTLAILLIASMSISASAASAYRSYTYNNASFESVTNCYTNRWNCLIEFMYSSNGYADYPLCVDVESYEDLGNGTGRLKQYTLGNYTTRIASNNVTVDYRVFAVRAYYIIDGTALQPSVWVAAT